MEISPATAPFFVCGIEFLCPHTQQRDLGMSPTGVGKAVGGWKFYLFQDDASNDDISFNFFVLYFRLVGNEKNHNSIHRFQVSR